jgi:hypothetical protein
MPWKSVADELPEEGRTYIVPNDIDPTFPYIPMIWSGKTWLLQHLIANLPAKLQPTRYLEITEDDRCETCVSFNPPPGVLKANCRNNDAQLLGVGVGGKVFFNFGCIYHTPRTKE